jgi:hypothetical protein
VGVGEDRGNDLRILCNCLRGYGCGIGCGGIVFKRGDREW